MVSSLHLRRHELRTVLTHLPALHKALGVRPESHIKGVARTSIIREN